MTQLYSSLRQGDRLNLAEAAPLPSPLTIYVEPTNICNFRCVYCPESFPDYVDRAHGLHRLDLSGFTRIADQILELGRLKTLNFYMMGEPFLNRSLPDFIWLATNRGLADRTSVTTNGTVLDALMIDRVLDSGLSYLRVSVYGGTEQTNAERTASRIPLAKVIANVRAIKDRRNQRGLTEPFLYVKMIESHDPVEDQAFLDTFRPICDEVALEPVMNFNDPEGHNLSLIPPEQMLAQPYFQHRKQACAFPFYTMVIHADLQVSVCCVDWAKQAVVGDLTTETLREIWHGDRLRQFQVTHLRGQRETLAACARCTYLFTAPDNIDGLSPDVFLKRSEHGHK